jgi:hypothetical protein
MQWISRLFNINKCLIRFAFQGSRAPYVASIAAEFVPANLWVGAYVKSARRTLNIEHGIDWPPVFRPNRPWLYPWASVLRWDVWVVIVPMFPLHLSWYADDPGVTK